VRAGTAAPRQPGEHEAEVVAREDGHEARPASAGTPASWSR
jgi:hypothetical protein